MFDRQYNLIDIHIMYLIDNDIMYLIDTNIIVRHIFINRQQYRLFDSKYQ